MFLRFLCACIAALKWPCESRKQREIVGILVLFYKYSSTADNFSGKMALVVSGREYHILDETNNATYLFTVKSRGFMRNAS